MWSLLQILVILLLLSSVSNLDYFYLKFNSSLFFRPWPLKLLWFIKTWIILRSNFKNLFICICNFNKNSSKVITAKMILQSPVSKLGSYNTLAEISETGSYLCSHKRNWGSPKEVKRFSLSIAGFRSRPSHILRMPEEYWMEEHGHAKVPAMCCSGRQVAYFTPKHELLFKWMAT